MENNKETERRDGKERKGKLMGKERLKKTSEK